MGCNHDCDNCGSDCGEKDSLKAKAHPLSNVKKVIGVISGKGGVGKSTVTALLACAMNKKGKKTAVLDTDVTGPSIPKLFGVKGGIQGNGEAMFPAVTKSGIEMISVNLLIDDPTGPVIWRGPVIGGAVKQFWSDVIWNDVDYMFVDMPPGTGDVALTVFQSLPVDGVIIVTSPQELSNMIVAKAIKMANMMNIPVIGLVENMSYFVCPDCGKTHEIFGKSHAQQTADEFGIKLLAKLPIDPDLTALCDAGLTEKAEVLPIMAAVDVISSL